MIVMLAAMRKGLYGGNKRLQTGGWFLLGVGVPSLALLDILLAEGRHIGLAAYHTARIQAMLHPSDYAEDGAYQTIAARSRIQGASLFGGGTIPETTNACTDYIVSSIAGYCGLFVIVLLLCVLGFFLLRSLHLSLRQKNRLGHLLALCATVILAAKSVWYVLANLGLLPATAIDMPFLSFGLHNTVMNDFCLGIILSVYRYTNVFGESRKKRQIKQRQLIRGNMEKRLDS
jgi:cell division protein FtsW (lipid II flippase)